MPQDPRRPSANRMDPEEYRRAQAAKAERRKKRRQQKMLVLGAFALAVIILVVCIVLVVRSIFKKDDASTTSVPSGSFSTSEVGGEGLSWPTASDKSVWNLWLVNEQHPVAADFARPEMERVVVNGVEYWFDERMWPSLEQMLADCNSVEGHRLTFYAGFRSYERQEEKFNYYLALYLNQGKNQEEAYQAAKQHTEAAGTADNHTGLAVEFMLEGESEPGASFATSLEYDWLLKNAANYGFILRYPANKEAITGVPYKAYHFRYVGVDDAGTINAAGICLEEYLADIPGGATGGGEAAPDAGTSLPEDATTNLDE